MMKLPAIPLPALGAPLLQGRGAVRLSDAAVPPSKRDEIAARKLAEAKQAVATLAMVKTKTSDDQKVRVAQRVKDLKARLQALKMLYAGDPKKLARAAAQIARELAGAVTSYTSAGGSAAAPGRDASGDSAGSAGGAIGDLAPGVEAGAKPGNADTAPSDAAPSAGENAKPEDAAPGETKAEGDKSAAQRAREKADEDFKTEARDLARALKAALRRKDPRHKDDGEDQRSGEQALAAVDQAVGTLPMADLGAVNVAIAL